MYTYFNSNDMIYLLSKEKEIIEYIEQQFKTTSTLKNKLCAVLKCYTLLNIVTQLLKDKIKHYKITQSIIEDYEINYINYKTNMMVINKHKNDRNGPNIIEIQYKDLMVQLHQRINKYLISNSKNELYKDSSAFTKLFSRIFNNYTPYDLRKCISSKSIHEGDTEKIKMLEKNQGQSLETILLYYNTYT